MELVITWATIKWLGAPLFILGLIALFFGGLPDSEGKPWANALRWVTWPGFVLWLIAVFFRGVLA